MDENPQTGGQEPEVRKPTGVRDLFVWRSFDRQAWSYGKEVFTTIGAVCLLLSIIFAFFQEWLAILLTWAAFFLFYTLSRLKPVEVEHKITTEGIVSQGQSYIWSALGPFWFSQSGNDTLLHIASNNVFGQIILVVQAEDKENLRDILSQYLPYVESVQKTVVEKMQDWFTQRFPLEKKANPIIPPLGPQSNPPQAQ